MSVVIRVVQPVTQLVRVGRWVGPPFPNLVYAIQYENADLGIVSLPLFLNNWTNPVAVTNQQDIVLIDGLGSGYNRSVTRLRVWRITRQPGPPTVDVWALVGYVERSHGGVFADYGNNPIQVITVAVPNPNAPFPVIPQQILPVPLLYESGIRWSEPYAPFWIREESFTEFRAGDGEQITGLAVLYGNLLVFKENSIGRYVVQDRDPPISRVDEVASDVGCIAPGTLISVNNTVYFLSWRGFMSYDNNVLRNVDERFHAELMWLLRNTPANLIRLSTCGYDPINNELLLCIPSDAPLPTWSMLVTPTAPPGSPLVINPWAEIWGGAPVAQQEAAVYRQRGYIFAIKLTTGFVTKYSRHPFLLGATLLPGARTARLWMNDKNGSLYAAEMFDRGDGRPAAIFWENTLTGAITDHYDDYISATEPPPLGSLGWLLTNTYATFPVIGQHAVYSYVRTKEFVGNDKLASIRVRRFMWQLHQPSLVPVAANASWLATETGRFGTFVVNNAGRLWDPNPANINVGYQIWLLGSTRTVFTAPSPQGDDSFRQSDIDWALGVWIPTTQPFNPSANTPSIIPMPAADAHTKPYRWSSVVELWGRAVVNGAAVWMRPYAEWLR